MGGATGSSWVRNHVTMLMLTLIIEHFFCGADIETMDVYVDGEKMDTHVSIICGSSFYY